MNDLIELQPENPFMNWEKYFLNKDFNKTCDGKDDIPEDQRLSPAMAGALKELLLGLVKFTVKIGGQIIQIGMKIVELISKTLELFPHTACGILIVVMLNQVTSHAMFGFRHIQQASVMGLYSVIIGAGFLIDVLGSDGFKGFCSKIASLGEKLASFGLAAAAI